MLRFSLFTLLPLFLIGGWQSVQAADESEHPHIVIVMVDDMGYGDPGCFNPESGISTPHIDQLASTGMRFTDAHAPGPLCHLSRYGLLTGRYPFRTNVGRWGRQPVIDDDQMTIASLLQSNGYRTAMVGKWHLGFEETGYENPLLGGPVDRGFDSFFGIRASTDIPPYFYIRDRRAVQAPTRQIPARSTEGWSPIQGEFWREGLIAPDLDLHDVLPDLTDEAINIVQDHARQGGDQPLFLYLALPAPHTPWLPAQEFRGKSKAGMYGDFVMHVDAMVGKVMMALEAAGMGDNTLFIFTSDNGPVWYDQDVTRFQHDSSGGLRGMKADAWEAGHRMPFIARWPKVIPAGSRSSQLICFTDLLKTLAAIIKAEVPRTVPGDSFDFSRVLNGTQPRDVNGQEIAVRPSLVMASGNQTMTIRKGNWKLIAGLGSGGFSRPGKIEPAPGQPAGQLYDLDSDAGESRNLYADYPRRVTELTSDLDQIREHGHQTSNGSRERRAERPNIVLVMSDDQGWGQTGYRGHPRLKTPNLDAMARSGLRLDRFYAAAPVCSPTRASVLTGRASLRTGAESHGFPLRRQEYTVARYLQEHGYATGHFGKWHLNGLRGPGVPILEEDSHHPGRFGFQQWHSVSNYFDLNPLISRNGDIVELQGDSSEVIVNEAVEFIQENARQQKPFLAVIWYGTPHGPFRALPADASPFADLDERTGNQLGELVAMDRSIGTLRSALREAGVADNTLVWFTSDNGGLPNMQLDTTGGLRGHKSKLYEGGLRVPAIVEWPARIKPRISDFPAVSMDIFPTIRDIVGLSAAGSILPQDGISLVPLFDSEPDFRETPIPFACFGNMAIIDNQYKLLRRNSRDGDSMFELYDVVTDPAESNELSARKPLVLERMKFLLDRYERSMQGSVRGEDYPEGELLPGDPAPIQWRDHERYAPFLDAWKERPEYRSILKSHNPGQ